jgi:hypothetical protein
MEDTMPLDDSDLVFVTRRSALVRRWPVAAWAMLAGIVAVLVFLFYRSPLLVNPWEVASRIKADTVAVPTLTLMAALLPVVFLSCFVLLVALVLFQFAAMANERRLLRIIAALDDAARGEKPEA